MRTIYIMKKSLPIAVVICVISVPFFAQNKKIDSLLTLVKTDKADTNKVKHLYRLCSEYRKISEYDKGLSYGKQALLLAQNLDFKKGEAGSYNNLANIYMYQGNYSEALKNNFASLKIMEAIGDRKGIAASYNNIGNIYYSQGNYPEALKNQFASLKLEQVNGNSPNEATAKEGKKGVAASYNNIGVVYMHQGNLPEALKSHFASLKIKETIGDKKGIASSYNNIANIYNDQGNYPEALKNSIAALKIYEALGNKDGIASAYNNIGAICNDQGNYPEALKNYFASLKIQEAIGDKQGIATSYNNLGAIYAYQGNLPKASPAERNQSFGRALKNYLSALKIHEAIGDKYGAATSFINLGALSTKLNNLTEASDYLNKGLELSKMISGKDLIKDSYKGLAELDSTIGNFKSEILNFKMYIIYRDSLINDEVNKKTIQSSMTYEFEKKEISAKAAQEKLDAISTEEKQKQKIVIYAVAGVLLLVIVFSLFLFNRFRITQRQKAVIEQQKHLVDEKQKEILDSIHYAKRIQTALITSEKYIEKNLNKLQKD